MQSSCRSLWIWKGKKGESFTSKQLNIGTDDWYQFNVQAKIFSLTYWNIVSFFWSGTIPDNLSGCEEGPSHPTAYVPGSSSSSSSHLSSFYFSTKLRLHLSFQMSDVQLEMKTDTSINQSPEELKNVRRFCSLSLV